MIVYRHFGWESCSRAVRDSRQRKGNGKEEACNAEVAPKQVRQQVTRRHCGLRRCRGSAPPGADVGGKDTSVEFRKEHSGMMHKEEDTRMNVGRKMVLLVALA